MQKNASTTAAGPDCGVVAELAREWATAAQDDQTGGERSKHLADKVRDAADSVSTPALKEELNKWADGFALLAEVQRADADSAATMPVDVEKITEAGDAIYETADALREACPDAWPARS